MSKDRPVVLIVEDDPDIASALERGLGTFGFEVICADSVASAKAQLDGNHGISAAIVDVMIGHDSGLDLVRSSRRQGVAIPMLMLSALSEVEDRLAGIEAGADDYVVKPFVFEELVARLNVRLKKVAQTTRPNVLLRPETSSIRSRHGDVNLTEREYQLLELLIQSSGTPLSRGEIFDTLWSTEGSTSENVVDVYIGYLRKKVLTAQDFPYEIKTIRGKGFLLSDIA